MALNISPDYEVGTEINWAGPVVPGGRKLSRQPSGEMRALANEVNVYAQNRAGICPDATINLCGSILMQQLLKEIPYQSIFVEEQKPAVFVTSQVKELFVYDNESKKYSFHAHLDSQVLVKTACGEVVGLILQGSYAGLYIKALSNDDPFFSMGRAFAARLINDHPTVGQPYVPYIHVRMKRTNNWLSYQLSTPIMTELMTRYVNLTESTLKTVTAKLLEKTPQGQSFHYSDMYISHVLCPLLSGLMPELGITHIDELHATRSLV